MKETFDNLNRIESITMDRICNVPLNATEAAALWNTYMQYTMFVCVFKYFVQTAEDPEIRSIMENALDICSQRVNWVADLFHKEGLPIPIGFTDKDVNLNAPRLYCDAYYLYYLINADKIAISMNGLSFVTSGRPDIRDFYEHCISSSVHMYNSAVNALLSKGIYIRPPVITISKEIHYAKEHNFLAGLLGGKRSLLAQEISSLFYGIVTNNIGKRLLMGFRQTAKSDQVGKYLERGTNLATSLIEAFSSVLAQEDVPDPMHWDFMVNDSTIPPFSDKLIMYHTILLSTAGLINYAASMGTSPRHDLTAIYAKAFAEVAKYGEDGYNIMIANGWFEEPFRSVDRSELVNEGKH